jgi:hypothetical protein
MSEGDTFGTTKLETDAINAGIKGQDVKIIRRVCNDCPDSHKEIYYKRLTDDSNIDYFNLLAYSWVSTNNVLNKDFKLYSTFEDAKLDKNPWKVCNYAPNPGFPRDCGPTTLVPHTWTRWNHLESNNRRKDYQFSYYVPVPSCTENGVESISESCSCSGNTCSVGEFCYEGKCKQTAMKCTADATLPMSLSCFCEDETDVCDSGKFCHSGGCQDAKSTKITSCQQMSNYYGVVHGLSGGCAPNEWMSWWIRSRCMKNPQTKQHLGCNQCVADGVTQNGKQCECSGDPVPCTSSQFCYDKKCQQSRRICASDNNEEKLTESCECSGTVCSVGKFCYLGSCATDCESSADKLTEPCAYQNADEELQICEKNKYFYHSACQDSKPNKCEENYFYPTTKDCVCGEETELCSSDDYCWDGECTGSNKCTPLDEHDAFYGGKVYGKWFESERKMGMSITTPKQVKITEIKWLKAKNDELKYVDSETISNIRDWRVYDHCYDCNTGDHSNPNSEDYDSLMKKGWKFTGDKANWVFSAKGYNDEQNNSKMSYQFKNTGSLQMEVQNKHGSGTIKILKKILTTENLEKTIQPGATETLTLQVENGNILILESEAAFININSWSFTKNQETRIDCSSKKDESTCNSVDNWPKDYCTWNTQTNTCGTDVCKNAYVLDIDQKKYFGPGANYEVLGSQMKTNLKVKAIANLHRNINKHDYSYDREIVNVVPVLVNLEVKRVVTCRFKIDTPERPEEGQQEFILQTYAEENLAESGRNTVKIIMEIYSNTCVNHSATSGGVSLTAGTKFLSTTDANPNTFSWDKNKEGKVIQTWEEDMCVETLTWIFVPVDYQADKYEMTLTFKSADMPSHDWSANVNIDIQDADVLADVGFGADMKTCKDKKCNTKQDTFRLGDRFWAHINLTHLAVNSSSITCETFIIKQTKDGKPTETNLMESKYNFKQTKPSEDKLNEHSCSAELESTHFHKSVEGYDTLLESDIKIEYVQGHTQTRRLLLNLAPQGMMQDQKYMDEISVGSSSADMTDEMYKSTPRKSDDKDSLSLPLTLLDMDASEALKTVEMVNSNINDYSAYIMLAAALCFAFMTIRLYSKSSQNKADSDFRLLAEEDIE